jgi:hypothetical protein
MESITYKKALELVTFDMPKLDAFAQSEILAILFDKDCQDTLDDILKLKKGPNQVSLLFGR